MIRLRCKYVCVWIFLGVVLFAWRQSAAQSSELNPLQLSSHHVTASVADLDKEAEWYQRVLGFRKSQRLGNRADFAVVQMTIPGYRIDLVWQKGSSRQHQAEGAFEQGWLHIVFQTPAIEAAYKRLVELGTDVKADRDSHATITHLELHDPEGNEIGISPE